MNAVDTNTSIIEGYLQLLDNLSPDNKLDLISRLSLSVKSDLNDKKSFYQAFGAWDTEQPAEEIINEIRNSRTFNRQTEEL